MEQKLSTAQSILEQLLADETAEPKALPLSLLEDITGDFSDDQEIGSGGFAVVYKGILGDRVVAVKRLTDAFMDENNFHREVECLMKVKHRNVVRFLGYCADRQGKMETYEGKLVMADFHQRLLCFEYIPKGSLDKYIIDPDRDWGMCYKIIKGICEGLQNLHDNCIVHLDLKPANILLDDNMAPKITDFGLSRCFNEKQSRDITKTILGTIGYMAPELREGGLIARSADIYSLGVIIIEILTGQKGYQATKAVLESWSGRVERLQQETLYEQIRMCYKRALECIAFNPMKRPASARNIIDRLHQMENNQKMNPDKGGGGGEQKKNNLDKDSGGSEQRTDPGGDGEEKKKNSNKGVEVIEQMKKPDEHIGGGEQKNIIDQDIGVGEQRNIDKEGGDGKQKKNNNNNNPDKHVAGSEQKKNPHDGGRAEKVTTVLLRTRIHCDGCKDKLKRYLFRFIGVYTVAVDVSKNEVEVVGSMDVDRMLVYLKDKLRQNVEVVGPGQKDEKKDKGGEKVQKDKDKAAAVGDVHRDDKAGKGIEVAVPSMATGIKKDQEKNKGGSGKGNGGNKQKDKAAAAGGLLQRGDMVKIIDLDGRLSMAPVRGPLRKQIEVDDGTSMASAPAAYVQPHGPPPSYYNNYGDPNVSSFYRLPSPGSLYQGPNHQPYPPGPQTFSDENPNACFVM